MTEKLKVAAQQALTALENATIPIDSIQMEAENAAIAALRSVLAEPEPVQEPVAWMYTGIKSDSTEHGPHLVWKPAYMDAMSASKGAQATPLYTAPPHLDEILREFVRLTRQRDALVETLRFIADHDLRDVDLSICGHIAHALVGKARDAIKAAEDAPDR